MAVRKYLDEHGLAVLVDKIKERSVNVYRIKGGAIYADADYLADPAKEAGIDSVGLWQEISGTWTKVTDVEPGWVFNVSNKFKTDADFIEGANNVVAGGTNIVAVNTGTDAAPVMKWDLLAMSLDVSIYQTKKLAAPLTVFTADGNVASASALPANISAAATVKTGTVYEIVTAGGDATDEHDLYIASVDKDTGDITWVNIGNQTTVEGALKFLGDVAPNTPITDAEIEALFA